MTNPIGALFGRSPIKPIEAHMAKSQSGVNLLGDFLEAVFQQDWASAEAIQDQIFEVEADADEIKRDIRTHLPRSLFLPVARADLLELVRIQDRIANRAKEICSLILIRKMEIPEDLVDPIRTFYKNTLKVSEQALKAVNELDELLETGFRGKEAKFVEELIAELGAMEQGGETAKASLLKLLFEHEQSMQPVEAMFLYKVVELIGDIAIASNKAGSRLLQLLAH